MATSDLIVHADELGNQFDLVAGSWRVKTGAGLSTLPDGTIVATLATSTVYVECCAGGTTTGAAAGIWARNATMTQVGTGRWQVVFDTPHPDGDNYHVSFSAEEPVTTRDNHKVEVEQGTKSATGFQFMSTTDDNGGTADVLQSVPVSWGVACPQTVVTGAA